MQTPEEQGYESAKRKFNEVKPRWGWLSAMKTLRKIMGSRDRALAGNNAPKEREFSKGYQRAIDDLEKIGRF